MRLNTRPSRVLSLSAIGLTAFLALSCGPGPTEPPDWASVAMRDAWDLLDVYFIFRERLPVEPESFSSPTALYDAANEDWTRYFDSYWAPRYVALLSTEVGGIGFLIDSVYNGYAIERVYDNSPGADAGLQAGDTLVAVDGDSTAGESYRTVLDWLGGDIGETRVLSVVRDTQSHTIPVVLGTFLAPSVFTDSLDSATAYILLTSFSRTTADPGGSSAEFHDALLQTAWASNTILDLRKNGGGSVGECLDITGEFVPLGTEVVNSHERVAYTRGSDEIYGQTESTTWHTESEGIAQTRMFYVLVDDTTASASEILVSCLRDRRTDIVSVGITTFGKGRAQYLIGYDFDNETYYLEDGGLAKITFSLVEPVLGAPYDSVGIEPDVAIGDGEDALDVALGLITGAVAKSQAVQRRTRFIEFAREMTGPRVYEPRAIVDRY